jgi:prepilin-type N-terminal cleavage/methylation domain-containing protein
MTLYGHRPGWVRRVSPFPAGAFTLVEIMIVVAIIALLGAIAIPAFAKARTNAQNARLIADLRTAKNAFIQYSFDHRGRYPADVTPGIIPAGMAEYLGRFPWAERTCIGGYWDWDNGQFGTQAGVSVYQPAVSLEQLRQIDQIIDNGDLATGSFRQRADGYISIIE